MRRIRPLAHRLSNGDVITAACTGAMRRQGVGGQASMTEQSA